MKKQKVLNTEIEKVKAIKRINERRAEIARDVKSGRLPEIYLEKYDNAINAAIKDPSLRTKSGNISHGSRAVESLSTKDLEGLLNRETAGNARRRMEFTYNEEKAAGYKLPDDYDQKKFNRDFNLVQKTLEDDYAEYYDAISELRSRWKADDWDPSYYDIARSIRSQRIKRGKARAAEMRAAETVVVK